MNVEDMNQGERNGVMSEWHPIAFADLKLANIARCEAAFHPIESWSPTDWMTAVAGEVGEAANLIKKGRRGESPALAAIADELADAVIYLDLLATRLGVDLGRAVAHKFNAVSERRGSTVKLLPHPPGPCSVNLWYQCEPSGDARAVPEGAES